MITRSVNNDTREEVLVAAYKCPDGLDWGQIGLCLQMDGYPILRSQPRGDSPNFVELQDAFRRVDYHLLNIKQTPCDGDGGVNVVIRFRCLYQSTPAVPGAEVLFPVAAEAMRSLASSAQGAAASTEQMSSAIGRIATSDNYAPTITPPPAPKPKIISPFSIGLGQRSIEV